MPENPAIITHVAFDPRSVMDPPVEPQTKAFVYSAVRSYNEPVRRCSIGLGDPYEWQLQAPFPELKPTGGKQYIIGGQNITGEYTLWISSLGKSPDLYIRFDLIENNTYEAMHVGAIPLNVYGSYYIPYDKKNFLHTFLSQDIGASASFYDALRCKLDHSFYRDIIRDEPLPGLEYQVPHFEH